LAIAAAVMEQNDGAAELRFGFHGFKLGEDRLDDFVRLLDRILVPMMV
jgi:hypothetical protein